MRMLLAMLLGAGLIAGGVTAQRPGQPDLPGGPPDETSPFPGVGASAISVSLLNAPLLRLPGSIDSNSPAIWDLIDGINMLHVMTSFAGAASLASGSQLTRLGPAQPVVMEGTTGGIWMEAVIKGEDGTWYGYYHNELPADRCQVGKFIPRIGTARSTDGGLSWQNLGIILSASPLTNECETLNRTSWAGWAISA